VQGGEGRRPRRMCMCILSATLGDITRNHHLSLLELSNLFMQRLRAAGAMAAGQGDGR